MRLLLIAIFLVSLPRLGGAQTTLDDLGIFPLPHKANFLAPYCLTHVFPGENAADRAACLSAHIQRAHTHFYVYPYNENDYSKWNAPSFDFYSDPQTFRGRLQEIIDAGMVPVVWLFPDDAPNLHSSSIAEYQAILNTLVPAIDDLVSSYVLGLELDEYFKPNEISIMGAHLDTLTDKKIGIHLGTGKTSGIENVWADYLVYQYGFGNSENAMISKTQSVLASVTDQYAKPVIAGEYARFSTQEAVHIQLGDAAISADPRMKSFGFGNGGSSLAVNPDHLAPMPPTGLDAD